MTTYLHQAIAALRNAQMEAHPESTDYAQIDEMIYLIHDMIEAIEA